ncbi:MAG: DUF4251 domain-containing protein [Flavobacteriales bacterium]|nr:DUF4251 domain-containing protein [Flavobacteriales bacterium]
MKKIFLLLLGLTLCYTTNAQNIKKDAIKTAKEVSKEAKKAAKEAKKQAIKAAEEAQEMAEFNVALAALKSNDYVLEAEKVEFKRGTPSFVNPNTNFVMLSQGTASVQLAPTNASVGANGIGGITVEGTASNIKTSTDAKGNVYQSFMVMGRGISAQVTITLTKGSDRCEAKISGNFGPDTVYFTGKMVPKEQSNVFKGRSL